MKRLPIILLLFLISFGFSNLNAQTIVVDTVINNIKIGPFTENKNLAFGVKNIIEEIINEQDSLILITDKNKADYKIKVELIFFDIVTTNSGVSIFHEDKTTTVIRMKGVLYKGDKKFLRRPRFLKLRHRLVILLRIKQSKGVTPLMLCLNTHQHLLLMLELSKLIFNIENNFSLTYQQLSTQL